MTSHENNYEEEYDIEQTSVEKDEKQGDVVVVPSMKRFHSAHQSSDMDSSVLKFNDINFVVKNGKSKTKHILSDVSGHVRSGHVLAIMGPSGAGKTTLISSLTLDAQYGKALGSVTLNGVTLTDEIFKQHCFVVKQQDKHWPYLTCRETLLYAAQLYNIASTEPERKSVVEGIIEKMGLAVCADTRNARLSGGQQRRLSVGVALLKQPRVLFLDEPTSGLDAASASAIMQEIVRVAREERLIILCTIHQPSTKVYEGFDRIMLMSRGRTAYMCDSKEAESYFESIGHQLPPSTNPAEFYLDLVNADFSDESAVEKLLDSWEEVRNGKSTQHSKHSATEMETLGDQSTGVVNLGRSPLLQEFLIMLRRQATVIVRDPILYTGRCGMFLMTCMMFTLVYLEARDYTQDQALNKFWLSAWLVGVPSNMGVVAVYALNEEFKSILSESKNGMVSGLSYVLAKTILVLPIMFIFAIFALGIPLFAIQDVPGEAFGILITLYAALMFTFESVAECLSVWFDDPILGMLQFMNFWFASFLFGGFLIPQEDMYWPFELFYHIMPYSYYMRSAVFEHFTASTWEPCTDETDSRGVCVNSTSGYDVLDEMGGVVPLFSSKDDTAFDIGIIVLIGIVYKLIYVAGVLYKTSLTTKFHKSL